MEGRPFRFRQRNRRRADPGSWPVLIDDGYAPQIVLAQDLCTKQMYRRYGGVGYDFVPAGVVPRLEDAGVPSSAINTMLVHNPAKLLAR